MSKTNRHRPDEYDAPEPGDPEEAIVLKALRPEIQAAREAKMSLHAKHRRNMPDMRHGDKRNSMT